MKNNNITIKILLGVITAAGIYKIFKANPVSANNTIILNQLPEENLVLKKIEELNDSDDWINEDIESIIKAIIQVESGNKNIIGSDGISTGLMQVIPTTAQWVLNDPNITQKMLLQPEINLTAGISYFLFQLNRYDDEESAIIAYHLGTDPYIEPQKFSGVKLDWAKKEADLYLEKVQKELSKQKY